MDKERHRKGEDGKRVASDNGRDGAAGSAASGRTVTVPSEIAQNLRVAEDGDITRYDASARNLVAEKPVLACILRSALDEYAGYTPQEIAERFIEGKPKVRTNAKIATVSKKGKVTVKAAGTVKIKATAKGGAKSKTITLKAK